MAVMVDALAERIEMACEFGQRYLGTVHPDSQRLAWRLRRFPDGLQLTLDAAGECIAESLLYLTSAGGTEALLDARIINGAQLSPADLAGPEDAFGIYVSVVAGRPGSGAVAMKSLLGQLERVVTQAPSVSQLFARPESHSGGGYIERLGLQPIGAPSEVWTARLDAVDLPRSRGPAD